MPIIEINMYKGRSTEEKKNICSAIQMAIKETYKIEHNNFHHRINEYDETNLLVPPSQSKNYFSLELDFFPGRSKGDKNKLYENITKSLESFNIAAEDIMIIIREPLLENWYIRGKSGEEIKQRL
jgi:phenylpyruvate tautomerase PptA (4-oxalocrotonate tautomerase family)